MKTNPFRFDGSTGALYQYDENARAYLFCSSTRKKTKKAAIKEYLELISR